MSSDGDKTQVASQWGLPQSPHSQYHSSPNAHTSSTQAPKTLAAIPSSPPFGEFLRIIPINDLAKKSVHTLIDKERVGMINPHHMKFISPTGIGSLNLGKAASRNSNETTDEAEDSEAAAELYTGYFRIGFEYESFTVSAKWLVGRGSQYFGDKRNVDVLLAVPGSKFSKGIGATHFILMLHPQSGVWMIRAVKDMIVEGNSLPEGKSQALYLPRTNIEIYRMQFALSFQIHDGEMERAYLAARNVALQGFDIDIPSTEISGIPLRNDAEYPSAIFRHGLGSGTFGGVFEGFDRFTGDLRAIKRVVMTSEQQGQLIEGEVRALTTLLGQTGIVQIYGWHNSLHKKIVPTDKLPIDHFIVQERGRVFSKYPWKQLEEADWPLRVRLCKQLLEGLEAIHKQGWMHRDINNDNLLYFPESQGAKICDFGKVCFSKVSRDSCIAAWCYLPPEVEYQKENEYDQAVDLWLLGQALTRAWYPAACRGRHIRSNNPDHKFYLDRYREMRDYLKQDGQSQLSQLLGHMMKWEVKARPSARYAQKYPIFNVEGSNKAQKQSDGKKPDT
ncbi:MAG: hypothetical protein Q9217_004001 [Psora testacea]